MPNQKVTILCCSFLLVDGLEVLKQISLDLIALRIFSL